MRFSPYTGFFGGARAPMTAYAAFFGASDLQIVAFSDMPADQHSPGSEGLVMHAQFSAGPGAPLMACDIPPGMGMGKGGTGGTGGTSVFHGAPCVATAWRVFDALSEGGSVEMPLDETFWSGAFRMPTDRFGTRWMISVAPGAA